MTETGTKWVVEQGDVTPLLDVTEEYGSRLARYSYGSDWIVVEAEDADTALVIAEGFDSGVDVIRSQSRRVAVPATEMQQFAQMYRSGAFYLGFAGEE